MYKKYIFLLFLISFLAHAQEGLHSDWGLYVQETEDFEVSDSFIVYNALPINESLSYQHTQLLNPHYEYAFRRIRLQSKLAEIYNAIFSSLKQTIQLLRYTHFANAMREVDYNFSLTFTPLRRTDGQYHFSVQSKNNISDILKQVIWKTEREVMLRENHIFWVMQEEATQFILNNLEALFQNILHIPFDLSSKALIKVDFDISGIIKQLDKELAEKKFLNAVQHQ